MPLFFGVVCEVEPDNTFALQIGGGVDYFIKDNIAINGELVWKLNSGDVEISVSGVPVEVDDGNTSVIEFTAGATILF